MKEGIIVLGMHRSGTSALTGILNLLGADLGGYLQIPDENHNPKGLWENIDFMLFNEAVFASCNSSWDDIRPLPDKWWLGHDAASARKSLRRLILRHFGSSALWAVKDPRICLLLPLWVNALQELDINHRFVMIFRHPLEVASSLERRDRFHPEKSALMWLRHTIRSIRRTGDEPCVSMLFDELISDPVAVARRVTKACYLDIDDNNEKLWQEIGEFVAPELRHHDARGESFSPLGRFADLCQRAWSIFQRLPDGSVSETETAALDRELRVIEQSLDPMLIAHIEDIERRPTPVMRFEDGLDNWNQDVAHESGQLTERSATVHQNQNSLPIEQDTRNCKFETLFQNWSRGATRAFRALRGLSRDQ